ncbi:MAG TPA: hypothetical protein VFP50_18185 [Anaeromyxobacteraceae bacterium]|nr:hypothetical protein [Anaeromyxobacteraceae bacterium]
MAALNGRGALAGGMSGASAGAAFGPVGAAIGGLGGGILGALSPDGSEYDARKRALIDMALRQIQDTNAEAGQSNYATNPDFLGAMEAYRDRSQGGMSGADRLAQQQAMNDAATASRMREGAILNGLASRGQAGGGAELAARLANAQGTTTAQFNAGANQAAAAQARALESLRGWGTMAGQQAGSQDAISQFNAQQRLNKAAMVGNVATGNASVYAQDAQRERQQSAGTLQGLGNAANTGVDIYQKWRKQQQDQAPGGGGQ